METVKIEIEIEKEIFEAIEFIAQRRGISITDMLKELTVEDLARMKTRLQDPMIGSIDSGRTDVSERDEELLFKNHDD